MYKRGDFGEQKGMKRNYTKCAALDLSAELKLNTRNFRKI